MSWATERDEEIVIELSYNERAGIAKKAFISTTSSPVIISPACSLPYSSTSVVPSPSISKIRVTHRIIFQVSEPNPTTCPPDLERNFAREPALPCTWRKCLTGQNRYSVTKKNREELILLMAQILELKIAKSTDALPVATDNMLFNVLKSCILHAYLD